MKISKKEEPDRLKRIERELKDKKLKNKLLEASKLERGKREKRKEEFYKNVINAPLKVQKI